MLQFLMSLALLAAPAAGSAPQAAADQPRAGRVHLCNGLKVQVRGAHFEDAPGELALEPGACGNLGPVSPGEHALRFIEAAGDKAAMCVRRVRVNAGDTVRLTPDDGANCIM